MAHLTFRLKDIRTGTLGQSNGADSKHADEPGSSNSGQHDH
jgi:hypothetical protein